MSTAERIAWGLLSFIALIVWLRWEGTPEDQNKDEPPQVPKKREPPNTKSLKRVYRRWLVFETESPPNQKLQQTKSLALAHLVINGGAGWKSRFGMIWYSVWSGWRAVGWESAMAHQYKAGDVVTVFQISSSKELVIEGKATIRKRLADVDEQYRVEFANKPGMTYVRFVDSWGQDNPEKYVQDFNRRSER
jgi:hypothetical protein